MAASLTTPSISVIPKSSDSHTVAPLSTCLDIAQGLDMVGDADALRELLDLAEKGLEHDLPAIARFLEQGDARGANQLLHSIKGFVPIFCTATLVQHVTQVELLSKSASAVEIAPVYAELAPALTQLHEDIRRYLETTPIHAVVHEPD